MDETRLYSTFVKLAQEVGWEIPRCINRRSKYETFLRNVACERTFTDFIDEYCSKTEESCS